jgi:hypothetical protein
MENTQHNPSSGLANMGVVSNTVSAVPEQHFGMHAPPHEPAPLCLPPLFVCGTEEAQNWMHDLARAGSYRGLQHQHWGGLRLVRGISVPAMRTVQQLLQGLWQAAVPVESALWLVGQLCVCVRVCACLCVCVFVCV